MALFQALIFFLMLLGFLSALLWLPALCLGVFLLARERGARPVLGALFALWTPALALVLCLPRLENALGVRLRDWLHTLPVLVWGLVSAALLLAVAWYAARRWPRCWVRLAARLGCALSVLAVLSVGGFWLGFTGCAEEVGQWQGEKAVMQEPGWTEGIYYYYRYDGSFLLGESLGWSEGPWEARESPAAGATESAGVMG